MNYDIFHLEARTPFHFGVRGVGIEETADHAASDTLFSALCHIIRLTEGVDALEPLLEDFAKSNPPFLISGAFPYLMMDTELLRFYPAPLSMPITLATSKHPDAKKIAESIWLSESVFNLFCNGQLDTLLQNGVTIIPEISAAVTSSEFQVLEQQYRGNMAFWRDVEVPRVAIDRVTNASLVFQSGRLAFVEGGGLWCMVAYRTDDWNTNRMNELLMELGDIGIGGERSAGNGQFSVSEIVSGTLPALTPGKRFTTLAHYRPSFAEAGVFAGDTAYALLIRRGWVSSPDGSSRRRKSVRMVTAGSVLTALKEHTLYGNMAVVTPDADGENGAFPHAVYRYGYALPVPLA